MTEKPRGDDLRHVPDENVARTEQIGEIRENSVADGPCLAIQNHESSTISRFNRMLRDAIGRKMEVEFGSLHGESHPGIPNFSVGSLS